MGSIPIPPKASQVDRDSQKMTVYLWVFTINRTLILPLGNTKAEVRHVKATVGQRTVLESENPERGWQPQSDMYYAVSYTHLRAHET